MSHREPRLSVAATYSLHPRAAGDLVVETCQLPPIAAEYTRAPARLLETFLLGAQLNAFWRLPPTPVRTAPAGCWCPCCGKLAIPPAASTRAKSASARLLASFSRDCRSPPPRYLDPRPQSLRPAAGDLVVGRVVERLVVRRQRLIDLLRLLVGVAQVVERRHIPAHCAVKIQPQERHPAQFLVHVYVTRPRR